jgi:hypothetical protein
MVGMEGKTRRIVVALCVIAAVIVASAVAVRLVLTRDRLMAMLLPRVEKALDAKVSIGDIGIRFPFGFGVDIEKLSFEKVLPDTSSLAFSSDQVTVRASLLSLIRRKPEISAADVRGGEVSVSNPSKRRDVKLVGLNAHFSMQPAGEGFSLDTKVRIDSVLVSASGHPPALALAKIGLDGKMQGDDDLTRVVIRDARVTWEDLISADVKGELSNLKTAPRVSLTIETSERPLAPIVDRAKSFRLSELSGTGTAPAAQAQPIPVELSGGAMRFSSSVEGLLKEPLGMNISFELNLKNLGVKAGGIGSIGDVDAAFKGQGAALAWQRLFPNAAGSTTASEIEVAWRAVRLDGTVEISDGTFLIQQAGAPGGGGSSGSGAASGAASPPIRISSLKARAELSGPDVKSLSGECLVGSSPFSFTASMSNMMPAASELGLVARSMQKGGKTVPSLGLLLDNMVNVPAVRFEAKGRSFDARPYEKPLWGAKEEERPAPSATAAAGGAAGSAAGGVGAILFLKNTTFTAKLDSIVAREAVITDLEAKGTIRDGRVKVDPVTFAYAGGKGRAVVSSDLRAGPKVETKTDFSLENVEVGKALGALSSLGNLLQGRFTVKSNAAVLAGPGVNPLQSLTADGSARSTKGTVDLERFIEPLTRIQGFDATPFEKIDFSEWTGTFVVKNGRFITDDWKIDSSKGAWSIKGSFGFDGSLDYAVHLTIPPAVQAEMKGIESYKSAFDLMRDSSGNLVLDIHIGGTAKHPSASLDLTRAKSKVQEKLIEGLKNRLLK